jgi:NADPH:quinone reductase-like Zn-dependent oxidoreductase
VNLLAPYGTVAIVGVLAGVEGPLPIPSLMFKRAKVEGVLVSDYTPEEALGQWSKIVATLQKRSFRPIIDKVFPFTEYHAAVEHLKSSPFGKVVLTMPNR